MATFYNTGTGGNYPERMTIRTDTSVVSQNVANNTSIIRIVSYVYYNYNKYNVVDPIGDALGYIRIDKQTGNTNYDYSHYKNFDYAGTSSSNMVKIMDWTSGPIAHGTDGKKTVKIDVYQDCPGVSTVSYMYHSFNWTLPAIARASKPTLSASSVALGSSVTITTNRADSSLTHALDYKVGSGSNVSFATSVGASYTWTLPAAIANQLKTSTSGTITITCYTWSGGSHVGTSTVTLTATIPNNSTYQPSVSLAIAEAATAMVGAGFWMAGKSAIKATPSITYKYGATLSSIAITINGVKYTSSPATSAVITTTGTKSVSVTVTDSRGFKGTASTTAVFKALSAPTLNASSRAFGDSVTITTNRPSTATTATLQYKIGSIANTQIATGVGASYAWTVPKSAIAGFTNAVSNTITITQSIYNGANLLGTGTVTLTGTIPASVPTTNVSTAELGKSVTVTTNRIHTSLTHTLKYTLGTTTTPTDVATGVGASKAWTLPASLASALSGATSGTLTFTLYTYNGTALVGSKTRAITVTVPDTSIYQPTVSAVVSEGNTTIAGVGVYISGKSKLKVVSTATAKNGATIASYSVLVNGSVYSGSNITSPIISATGYVTVEVTARDSRGYSATYSTDVFFVSIDYPTFSLSSVNLGSSVTITTNRASGQITHTLKYVYGEASGTISTAVGASHKWTLPNSMASGFPSSASGSVKVTQESYYNGNLLNTRTASFTAVIPDSETFRPVPAVASIVEGAAGLPSWSVFIQGKSRLKVTSSVSLKHGATLARYNVSINGMGYVGSPVTTPVINTVGAIEIKVKATDSRGYSSEITYASPPTVVAYSPPQLINFQADRVQDVDLSTPINFSISPVSNKNSKSYKIEYRPTGGSWVTAHTSTASYALNTTLSKPGVLSNSLSYEVRATVSDYFASSTKTITIGTGFSLMDFRHTGKGIALGKVSEKDALEVAMPAEFTGGIYEDGDKMLAVQKSLPSGTDLNTVTRPGSYRLSGTHANMPAGCANGQLQVVYGGGDTIAQMIFPYSLDGTWRRSGNPTNVGGSGSWRAWKDLNAGVTQPIVRDMLFPIGAVYQTVTNSAPDDIVGGIWTSLGSQMLGTNRIYVWKRVG